MRTEYGRSAKSIALLVMLALAFLVLPLSCKQPEGTSERGDKAPEASSTATAEEPSVEPEPAKEEPADDWFGVYMMGNKIGWVHEETEEMDLDGRKVVVSKSTSRMAMARMGTTIEIEEDSEVLEDSEGKLVSFNSRSKQSAMENDVRGKMIDGKLRISRKTGGKELPPQDADWNPECLTPGALKRVMKEKGLEPGTSYKVLVFTTMAPERPVECTVEVKGMEEVDVLGAKKNLQLVESTMAVMGMKVLTKTWVDENWSPWKMNQMGTVDLYRLPKELATRKGDVKEIFVQTIIPVDKKIEDARGLRKMRYRLSLEGEGDFSTLPTGARQKVVEKGEGYAVVEISADDPGKPVPYPVESEGMQKYLISTPFLQADDPALKKITGEVVEKEGDSLAAARKLEHWVFENIKKKNFGVGFATAAEVAKNLEGDCSEHAVLLAALCRAAGIPSRVVAGVIYADVLGPKDGTGGFGFHLWTEVYVGSWFAMDATLGDGFADATHIALARSALESESSMFELVPIGTYLGKLKISVLEE